MEYIEIDINNKELVDEAIQVYRANNEYFNLSGDNNITEKTINDDFNVLPEGVERKNKHYLLVKMNGEALAVLDFIAAFPNIDTVYLGFLLIKDNLHRKGFGTEIYKNFEMKCLEKGFNKIRLGVLVENIKGMSFWKKMGFSEVKVVKSSVRPEKDWTICVMEKYIKKVENQ